MIKSGLYQPAFSVYSEQLTIDSEIIAAGNTITVNCTLLTVN